MNDVTISQAKAAFVQGVEQFERGELLAARVSFQQALDLAPGRPSVLLNLGLTQFHLGEHGAAQDLLQAAVNAQPDSLDAWTALAQTHFAQSKWAQAVDSHERALALGANAPELRQHLAESLARLGRHPQAALHCQALVEQDDSNANHWAFLGDLQREMGQLPEAAHSYRQALARGGDAEMLHHSLAALSPQLQAPAPPRRYVQSLFEEYAADFDEHLVGLLHYQGHRKLIEQLPEAPDQGWNRVLDLGCGTGLCGPLIRPWAQHLSGVDLSQAMVSKAHERGVYDHLVTGDIHDHLAESGPAFDLVLAADVFIYVGPLERTFELLARRMAPRACLAFTVEPTPLDAGVQLLPSLRYAHSIDYLRKLAQAHGFTDWKQVQAPIRWDQDQPVDGLYIYMRKP
jgi:predicted TPR repeat methyltransferase